MVRFRSSICTTTRWSPAQRRHNAALGQSVWRAVARDALFTLRSAWGIERRRQLAKHLPLLGNRYIQQWLLTALIIASCNDRRDVGSGALRRSRLRLAYLQTEYVNYAQHYGLSRESRDPPRGSLSWNSNSFMTNAFTLNITRHVHHHLDAGVPYYGLEAHRIDAAAARRISDPVLPAMIPPVWRRLMDARARAIRNFPD